MFQKKSGAPGGGDVHERANQGGGKEPWCTRGERRSRPSSSSNWDNALVIRKALGRDPRGRRALWAEKREGGGPRVERAGEKGQGPARVILRTVTLCTGARQMEKPGILNRGPETGYVRILPENPTRVKQAPNQRGFWVEVLG